MLTALTILMGVYAVSALALAVAALFRYLSLLKALLSFRPKSFKR